MKKYSNSKYFNMKTETNSDRFWIEFGNHEIANKLEFLGKHYWSKQNILLPHVHSTYEIIYIFGGKGSIVSRGIEYNLKTGDIFIVEPNTEHEGKANPDQPFELFFFGYDFNTQYINDLQFLTNIDEVFLKFFEAYIFLTQRPIIKDNQHIGTILEKLITEINVFSFLRA